MVAGKKTAWNLWEAFPEITDVLARLSLTSADIADDDLTSIERYVVLLYNRTGSTASVNGVLHWLFMKKVKSMDNSPQPSTHFCNMYTILFHKTAACAKLKIYSNFEQVESSLGGMVFYPYGWPLQKQPKSCQELVNCGCKKNCTGCCKYRNAGFRCTELCQCSGGCTNIN